MTYYLEIIKKDIMKFQSNVELRSYCSNKSDLNMDLKLFHDNSWIRNEIKALFALYK